MGERAMTTVCVIGGTGYFGGAVAEALRVAGFKVALAGRGAANDVHVNLTEPKTFAALRLFEAVVNCSDALIAPPMALMDTVLREGGLLVETTAVPRVIEEGIGLRGMAAEGRVILGMGIFPGVSNILAREVHDAHSPCHRLDVAIRTAQFSGAGGGMCSLMTEAAALPAVYFEDGARVEGPAVANGPRMPFGHGARRTVRVGLPEPVMLHASLGVASSTAYLAPDPGFLRHGLLSTRTTNRIGWLRGSSRVCMDMSFRAIRMGVFRGRRTPSSITAVANGSAGMSLRVSDGIAAGGYAVAAALRLMARKRELSAGVLLPDEVFEIYEMVDTMREVAAGAIELHLTERVSVAGV